MCSVAGTALLPPREGQSYAPVLHPGVSVHGPYILVTFRDVPPYNLVHGHRGTVHRHAIPLLVPFLVLSEGCLSVD